MRISILVVLLAFAGCKNEQERRPSSPPGAPLPPTDDSKIPPKPPEVLQPSAEGLARKERSEKRLISEGVAILKSLPVLDDSAAKIRDKDAVVDRALALMVVAVKGEGLEADGVQKLIKRYAAEGMLSPEEKAFVANGSPTEKERAKFTWRYEGLAVLLWALGFSEELKKPSAITDVTALAKIMIRENAATKLREGAKLRSRSDILDQADLIYRYDWACTNARVAGKPAPQDIDCEVVVERHWALNWLIRYMNAEWDDISTDT